jgi:hypothetical protein
MSNASTRDRQVTDEEMPIEVPGAGRAGNSPIDGETVPTMRTPRGEGLSRNEQDTEPVDGDAAINPPAEQDLVQRQPIQG